MATKQYWQPSMPIEQGIYEESSTQKADLGIRLVMGDRVFYYAQAGAEISSGSAVSTPDEDATAGGLDSAGLQATVAAGVYSFNISLINQAAIALNHYREGYVAFLSGSDVTTVKHDDIALHRISNQPAMAISCSDGAVALQLYDPITAIKLSTDHVIQLVANMFLGVVPSNDAGATATGLGVAPIAVTDAYYFWLQTWGPCAVTVDGAATVKGVNYIFDSAAGTQQAGPVVKWAAADMSQGGGVAGVGLAAGTARSAYCDGIIYLQSMP